MASTKPKRYVKNGKNFIRQSDKHKLLTGFSVILSVLVVFVGLRIGSVVMKSFSDSRNSGTTVINNSSSSRLRDIAYGSEPLQKLDIYPATDGQIRPVMIMIHGGGWTKGDKTMLAQEAAELAAHGYTVFNANYRLADATHKGYPMEVDDVKAVVAWVTTHGHQYQADPTMINLIGGSAGGHLVSLTGLQLNTQKAGTIRAVASLSGPQDFTVLKDLVLPGSAKSTSGIPVLLGCTPQTTCSYQLLAEASPISNVNSKCPSMYLLNSTKEVVPTSQAQSMYDTLKQAGCDAKLQLISGELHAFSYWDQIANNVIAFFDNP